MRHKTNQILRRIQGVRPEVKRNVRRGAANATGDANATDGAIATGGANATSGANATGGKFKEIIFVLK